MRVPFLARPFAPAGIRREIGANENTGEHPDRKDCDEPGEPSEVVRLVGHGQHR